ncbi:hypothetical protein GQR58_002192 [Nymphon striatum]|nr:hypothetical protein GQR58_002192 [Nymphon striatum]
MPTAIKYTQMSLAILWVCLAPISILAQDYGNERRATLHATLPNGGELNAQWTYDDQGLVTMIERETTVQGQIITETETLTYNDALQVLTHHVETLLPFVPPQIWDHSYVYENDQLVRIEATANDGTQLTKTFGYDDAGRILSRETVITTNAAVPSTSSVQLQFNDDGLVTGQIETDTSGSQTGEATITFSGDRPVSFTRTRPREGTVTGTTTYYDDRIVSNELHTPAQAEGLAFELDITSKFEAGPCIIPTLSDGIVIDRIFDSHNGFYPSAACRLAQN